MKLHIKERLLLEEVMPLIQNGADTFSKIKKQTSLPDNDIRAIIRFGSSNWVRSGISMYKKLDKTSPKTYIVLKQGK
tara:strand:- start:77 stop:307 length:231 start_codon:yes stop_codon:yes gene_type:complete